MDETKKLAQQIAVDLVSTSRLLSSVPCLVYSAGLTAGSAGGAVCILYDGNNTTTEQKIYLSCVASAADFRRFNPPLYFRRGLYVYGGGTVAAVTVQYQMFKE